MAIVVIPKTEVECNQLRSVLHSQGRNLWATCAVDALITVGKVVFCWDFDKLYAVRPVTDPVLDLNPTTVDHVPVQELYERLQNLY